jgi:tRNA (mo5U34)-methyltransferase
MQSFEQAPDPKESPCVRQQEIDEIDWYHAFEFGDGLRATPKTTHLELMRSLWKFTESSLDRIDFEGKTVLDVGCWDGYWSFYAERRGAKRVLATDDISQNPLQNTGLHLAKRLLKSNIETKKNVSVYELSALGETFDIVLCLGVYYHLIDPLYAFAQIRHCLRPDSLAVFEGDVTMALRSDCFYWDPRGGGNPIFIPSPFGLRRVLEAAYLETVDQDFWKPPPAANPLKPRIKLYKEIPGLQDSETPELPEYMNRAVTITKAFEAQNRLHLFRPPFGLDRYDPRFRF